MKRLVLLIPILLMAATFAWAVPGHQTKQTKSKELKEVKCPRHPHSKSY